MPIKHSKRMGFSTVTAEPAAHVPVQTPMLLTNKRRKPVPVVSVEIKPIEPEASCAEPASEPVSVDTHPEPEYEIVFTDAVVEEPEPIVVEEPEPVVAVEEPEPVVEVEEPEPDVEVEEPEPDVEVEEPEPVVEVEEPEPVTEEEEPEPVVEVEE